MNLSCPIHGAREQAKMERAFGVEDVQSRPLPAPLPEEEIGRSSALRLSHTKLFNCLRELNIHNGESTFTPNEKYFEMMELAAALERVEPAPDGLRDHA